MYCLRYCYLIYFPLLLFLVTCTGCTTAQHQPVSTIDLPAAAVINTQLGLAYLVNGDSERAKQKLLLANQQSPKDPLVYDALGYFYERTGDVVSAGNNYEQALKLAPKSGVANNNYGAFLCRQGQYRQAIDYFMAAIVDPNYLAVSAAYQNAGHCALKIPDEALAKQYFQQAKASNGE